MFFCCFFLPPQAEWVALNYVPFAERSLEVVVDLYHKTACHKAVINEKVQQNIIKVFKIHREFYKFWFLTVTIAEPFSSCLPMLFSFIVYLSFKIIMQNIVNKEDI